MIDLLENNSKPFINEYSWRCLLGPTHKNAMVVGGLATWSVGVNKPKKHFCTLGDHIINEEDIEFLKSYKSCSFYYLTEQNCNILKEAFDINKEKFASTCVKIDTITYSGRSNHDIRGAVNKNKKLGLIIKDNYDKFEDVQIMLDEWSSVIGDKYFRDFSGKNKYYFKNNFHLECNNTFIYDQDKLVAFASLSPGEHASYVIGKALYHKYGGLSEYADVVAYERAVAKGTKMINMGRSVGKLASYKNKFPNSCTIINYNGKIL